MTTETVFAPFSTTLCADAAFLLVVLPVLYGLVSGATKNGFAAQPHGTTPQSRSSSAPSDTRRERHPAATPSRSLSAARPIYVPVRER